MSERAESEERICILIPSFGTGGAEKVGVNLANAFGEEGREVDLVAISPVGQYRELVSPAVSIVDLNASRGRYSIIPLRQYLRAARPTVLLSVLRRPNIYAAVASLGIRGLALYFREASPLLDLRGGGLVARSMPVLMRHAYRRASGIIANSPATRDDLVRYGVCDAERITVLPNPVLPREHAPLSSEEPPHPWLRDPDLKVVLSVGGLRREKNQRLLIDTFAGVAADEPSARLVILGEGPERKRLEERVRTWRLDGRVVLHPVVSNPYPFYAGAAVFVLTSSWEGFGNVLVEALSAGIPVVCSDCPGAPRWILGEGRFGDLVPPDDVDATAAAILRAIRGPRPDPAPLVARAEKFGIDRVAAAYARELGLGEPPAPPGGGAAAPGPPN